MKLRIRLNSPALKFVLALAIVFVVVGVVTAQAATVSVFATGLDNPRGLKFGPDGKLYVAEGGRGGSNTTFGQCTQVIPPVGPYTGGYTARISKINSSGVRTTVVDNLPSSQTSPALGSLVSGVADVAFIGNTLYALLAGAGCSHGIPDVPNAVIKVNRNNGTWTLVADLSAFQATHPVAHPNADDFEPDGTWYSMIAVDSKLFAVEPNHGELDEVNPNNGAIHRIIDVSASQGHIVPTAVTFHRNRFYLGNLDLFPVVVGSSKIFKVTRNGQISVAVPGVTTVLGVAFDDDGRLYVLEMSEANGGPVPFTGKILRFNHSGDRETIASGLNFPTGMTFGPDGDLYVSNFGFGFPPGSGQILRIQLDDNGDGGGENED
jgi:hypothetical protein